MADYGAAQLADQFFPGISFGNESTAYFFDSDANPNVSKRCILVIVNAVELIGAGFDDHVQTPLLTNCKHNSIAIQLQALIAARRKIV